MTSIQKLSTFYSFHHSVLCWMSHLVIKVSNVSEHRLVCQLSKVYYIVYGLN